MVENKTRNIFRFQRKLQASKWAAIVLTIGFITALFAGYHHAQFERAERFSQFERQSALISNAIKQQMNSAIQIVKSMQSSFLLNDSVNQEEFNNIYQNLSSSSAFYKFQTIYFAKKGKNDSYQITLIAPKTNADKLIGLNLKNQKEVLNTILETEKSSDVVMTTPFTFNTHSQAPQKVAIHAPTYNKGVLPSRDNNPTGSIGLLFDINDLVKYAIPKEEQSIAIKIIDITNSPMVVYQTEETSDFNPLRLSEIDIGNKIWQIEVRPTENILYVSLWPFLTFFLITLAAVLISGLVYNSFLSRQRASDLALEMTDKYKKSEERFKKLLENLQGFVLLCNHEGKITYANQASRERLGISLNDDSAIETIFNNPDVLRKLNNALIYGVTVNIPQIELVDSEKVKFWSSLSISRIYLDEKPFVLILSSEVTEIVQLTEQLDMQSQRLLFLATHDDLTGLPNRRAFEELLGEQISKFKKTPHKSEKTFALMYADLDQFKIVNDTAGHLAGDKLLCLVADGLRQVLPKNCHYARLGGDEFGIIVTDLERKSAEKDCVVIAENIREFFNKFSFNWEGKTYHTTSSIGVSIFSNETNKEELMSKADAACYIAKDGGRNKWYVFGEEPLGVVQRNDMEWVVKIKEAISLDKFRLYYQEIIPLKGSNKRLPHFEILLRMIDNEGNEISAYEFIPAAEKFGLMPQIDRLVIKKVFKNFKKLHPTGDFDTCSINISGDTIDDPDFENFIMNQLYDNNIPGEKLCIEITETSAIRNMDKLIKFIPKLRSLGCRLALDDFGVGMSSFSYMKNIKVDMVKIDGSFIRDIENNVISESIVSAVSDLAHNMNMKVVAEWVSSEEVKKLLIEKGVDYGQGFYLHEPQPIT